MRDRFYGVIGDALGCDSLNERGRVDRGQYPDREKSPDPVRMNTQITKDARWFVENPRDLLKPRQRALSFGYRGFANETQGEQHNAEKTERGAGADASGKQLGKSSNRKDQSEHKHSDRKRT